MAKKQPKPNPLRKVADVRRWMREHAEPEPTWDKQGRIKPSKWGRKNLNEAVLWWGACLAASEYVELRTKDIAQILLAGFKPFSVADLQEALDSMHDSEDESEPAAHQLETHLRAHFGLGETDHG